MMEESHPCECHGNAVFVARLNDVVVPYGTAGLCHIAYTALVGSLDIVAKGEECIRPQTYIRQPSHPFPAFLVRERCGALRKELLPFAVAQYLVMFRANENVDGVVSVCPSYVLDEG